MCAKQRRPDRKAAVLELTRIAMELLPTAQAQAAKNRPRLLTVCARIILSARRMKLSADKLFIGGPDTSDLDEMQ